MKGLFADGAVRLHRRALHDHRPRRAAQAGAAPASADHDRRRRQADAALRRTGGRHHRASTRRSASNEDWAGPERRRRHRRGDRPQGRLDPRGRRRALRRHRAVDRRAVRRRDRRPGRRWPRRSPAGSTPPTASRGRPDAVLAEPLRAARHGRRDRRHRSRQRRERWGISYYVCNDDSVDDDGPHRRSASTAPERASSRSARGDLRRRPPHGQSENVPSLGST